MADALLKNNEVSQNEYENFETDENKTEELKKRNKKSKLKSVIISIILLVIFSGFIYYKFFYKSQQKISNSLPLLEQYNNLGKKDENLELFLFTELFLAKRNEKYMNVEIIFHLKKDDVDKDKLLKAIKLTVENQGVLQSIFYEKNNKYYIKFDKNLYPEIISKTIKESDYQNYLNEIEKQLDFSLNKLMYKIYIIQTESSLYSLFFFHHAIFDKTSLDALVHTLNQAYISDIIPFKNEDYFYGALYEYNLKLRNEKQSIYLFAFIH